MCLYLSVKTGRLRRKKKSVIRKRWENKLKDAHADDIYPHTNDPTGNWWGCFHKNTVQELVINLFWIYFHYLHIKKKKTFRTEASSVPNAGTWKQVRQQQREPRWRDGSWQIKDWCNRLILHVSVPPSAIRPKGSQRDIGPMPNSLTWASMHTLPWTRFVGIKGDASK